MHLYDKITKEVGDLYTWLPTPYVDTFAVELAILLDNVTDGAVSRQSVLDRLAKVRKEKLYGLS